MEQWFVAAGYLLVTPMDVVGVGCWREVSKYCGHRIDANRRS